MPCRVGAWSGVVGRGAERRGGGALQRCFMAAVGEVVHGRLRASIGWRRARLAATSAPQRINRGGAIDSDS